MVFRKIADRCPPIIWCRGNGGVLADEVRLQSFRGKQTNKQQTNKHMETCRAVLQRPHLLLFHVSIKFMAIDHCVLWSIKRHNTGQR